MDHHRGRPFGDDGIIPRRVLKVSSKLKDDNLAEVGRSTGESGQKGVIKMQIRISKLRDKLSLLQSVVPKKPSLGILSHVLVRNSEIIGTDLETRVSIHLDEANGANILLPFKSVMDFLKYVPGDETITIEPKDKKVDFTWKGGSASFETKDPVNFPELNLKEPISSGMINGDRLIEALVAAVKYCSTEVTKPVLSGVTLYLGNVLQVAASDGFRLSFQSVNLSYQHPTAKTIVIPSRTIAILEDLWKKEPAQAAAANDLISQITASRELELSLYTVKEAVSTMVVKFGKITLSSRLIAGTPPDHLALLNNFKEPNKALFLGPDLYRAVKRVSGVAKDGSGIVRMEWDESQMTVSSGNKAFGSIISDKIPIQVGSIPGRIAINVSYLLDYLADKSGLVTIGKSEDVKAPVLLHYGNRPIVALMPMAVKWDDEQPVAEKPTVKATGPEDNTRKPVEKEAVGAVAVGKIKKGQKQEKSKPRSGRKKVTK